MRQRDKDRRQQKAEDAFRYLRGEFKPARRDTAATARYQAVDPIKRQHQNHGNDNERRHRPAVLFENAGNQRAGEQLKENCSVQRKPLKSHSVLHDIDKVFDDIHEFCADHHDDEIDHAVTKGSDRFFIEKRRIDQIIYLTDDKSQDPEKISGFDNIHMSTRQKV